jgi:replicative DNA helicase
VHGIIWGHLSAAIDNGKEATPLTMLHLVRDDPMFEELGNAEYLMDLVAGVLSVRSAPQHAQIVIDLHDRRQAILAFEQGIDALHQDMTEVPSASVAIEQVEGKLDTLRGRGPESESEPIGAPLSRAILQADKVRHGKADAGVQTGFTDLDKAIGGLHVGDLMLLAARPGMGKTALATKIGVHVAANRGPVLIATMEMTAEQLAMRICCEQAGVEYTKTRSGTLNDIEYQSIASEERRLAALPLEILDRPGLTLSGLRAACRRFKRRNRGLALVIIDYLGLLSLASGDRRRSRYEEVSDLSGDTKRLSKAVGAPILALHQLSRANEGRDNKRPQLSDLRDSGNLEQDADQVAFIHREVEYIRKNEPTKRENETTYDFDDRYNKWNLLCGEMGTDADLIIAKNRHGSQGNIKLYFDAVTMSFMNAAGERYGNR